MALALVQQDPAFNKPFFKNESKPVFLYNDTFPELVVRVSYTLLSIKLCIRKSNLFSPTFSYNKALSEISVSHFLNPILLGRGGGGGANTPPPVFLHHPKTAQGIKLKHSDFNDTPLRHFLQVKLVVTF